MYPDVQQQQQQQQPCTEWYSLSVSGVGAGRWPDRVKRELRGKPAKNKPASGTAEEDLCGGEKLYCITECVDMIYTLDRNVLR